MDYTQLCNYMGAGAMAPLRVIESQFTFNGNILAVIWEIIFSIPILAIEFAFYILLILLMMIGRIVLFIPLINLVYSVIFEVVHFIAFCIGLIGNVFSAKDYIYDMKLSYNEDLTRGPFTI